MLALVSNSAPHKHQRRVSPEFQHAFGREVLKTERLRIKALIIVATVVAGALSLVGLVAPEVLDRIWHGHFPFLVLFVSYGCFVLFEASVLGLITRQIKLDRDVPTVRRFLSVLIETSLPSAVVFAHMSNMGAAQALAFVGPLLYF